MIPHNGHQVYGPTGELIDDDFELLDIYAPRGVVAIEPRVEWLATISAGEKTMSQSGKEIPKVSRDGTIYLHDDSARGQGLAEVLQEGGYKSLTVAFAHDRLGDIIHSRFTRYSQTRCEVFGDSHSLTEIAEDGKRTVYPPHHDRYRELLTTCKVDTSVFFVLARWNGGRPQMFWPDGYGFYRVRFTGRNSLRAVVDKLVEVRQMTGNRLAGIPFELSLTYRDVTDRTAQRRNVPVWTLSLKPPETLTMDSGNFRSMLSMALAEGAQLRLEAPHAEAVSTALLAAPADDYELPDFNDEDVARWASTDPPCDPEPYRRAFFASIKGTEYEDDEKRGHLIWICSDHETRSLKELLASATESRASAFCVRVNAFIAEARRPEVREKASRLLEGTSRTVAVTERDEPPAAELPEAEPTRAEATDFPDAATTAEPMATREQVEAIERLGSPSQVRSIDFSKLTQHDAGVLIQELNPPRQRVAAR